jgi:CMP-N-acetylneuraminic acid synthetase
MDEISSIDIDNLYDFRFAEFILKFSKTYEQ